jgi:hypothetical protein
MDYVVVLMALLLLMIGVHKFVQGPTGFVQDPWNYISLINYGMRAKTKTVVASVLPVSQHAGDSTGSHADSWASLTRKHCRSRKMRAKLVHRDGLL